MSEPFLNLELKRFSDPTEKQNRIVRVGSIGVKVGRDPQTGTKDSPFSVSFLFCSSLIWVTLKERESK